MSAARQALLGLFNFYTCSHVGKVNLASPARIALTLTSARKALGMTAYGSKFVASGLALAGLATAGAGLKLMLRWLEGDRHQRKKQVSGEMAH